MSQQFGGSGGGRTSTSSSGKYWSAVAGKPGAEGETRATRRRPEVEHQQTGVHQEQVEQVAAELHTQEAHGRRSSEWRRKK